MKHIRAMKMARMAAASLIAIPVIAVMAGCNGSGNGGGPTPLPTPLPTATPTAVPAHPFAGRYTGIFTGDRGQQINGSFAITVNNVGVVTGTARQRELPDSVLSVSGTISETGQVNVAVRGTVPAGPNNPLTSFTSRLTGSFRTDNGVTTGSGRFTTTTSTNSVIGTGTWKAIKKS